MFLPDVKVLLALAFEAHQYHISAREWFDTADSCLLCRMTQSAFLRLATSPAVFGDEALSLSDAWSCYDSLASDERLTFSLEPVGIEHAWRRLTMLCTYSPKVWNDRYLAAFAITGEATLVSFDTAFRSIPRLEALILSG
jgi:uncharacterized protein